MADAQKVTIWHATLQGEWGQIDRTRARLEAALPTNFAYTPENAADWVIAATEEEVPVVAGRRFICISEGDPEDVYPHVLWECPHCGHPHTTDEDERDVQHLWHCAFGNGIALVNVVEDDARAPG